MMSVRPIRPGDRLKEYAFRGEPVSSLLALSKRAFCGDNFTAGVQSG